MVETKRETPGKTPKNKAVKLRTEEEEETAQQSTRNEGQAAMQISIEVERNECADQTGVEKAEVDQKVAGAAEANEINREDKSTDPKISEKMVSAEKNRKRNAAKLVAGAENTGSLAAGTVDVDRFAGEQQSTLNVADESKNEEILALEYVQGEQKKEVIVDSNQIVGKSEQKCVPNAELETESPQTVKKILEVAKADESAAKTLELQQNESEKEIEVTVKTETEQKLSEKMEIDEMVEKKFEKEQSEGKRKKSKKRKRAKKVKEGEGKSEQENVPKAELEMESPQTVKTILEVAKADESAAKTLELQQIESEKEIEVTVKKETEQKLSEKTEIDEMVEKKIESEQSEGKCKKIKKRKRAKKVKEEEGKSEQENVPKAKLEMESPQTVKTILEFAQADESTVMKVEQQQNESEKEIEVTVKTETEQKFSEKMEIDEMLEKKIENEQSEGNRKKSKKTKRAKKVKEGEGKSEQESVPKAKLEMESPQTVTKILEVAKADESTANKVELQQNESEKEIEVTVTEQKLLEKMEIDEMVEKKIENEQSEGKRKKSKKRKRAKKVNEGEGKSEQENVPKAKLEMESPQTVKTILEVAKADESIVKKVELQQNESEKEIEVTVTAKKLSEKMEIDEVVEKKIENEQSEGKRKKRKKRKRAKKVEGGELKKITEEEGEVKKNAQEEGEVKTMKVDGIVENNPQDDHSEGKRKKNKKKKRKKKVKGGKLKKSTHEEGEVKTMKKVDGTVEKNPENDQSKSKKMNGANIEEGGQLKKTRQEETATEEQQQCNAIEVIEMLVDSLTKDELLEVVKSTALKEVGFSAHVDRIASRDELKRTICIESLSHSTNSEMLREAFLQYGQIEKVNVAVHKESGHSRGFGFVVFTTKSSALSAVRHPVQKINGRLSHCSLTHGQRNRSHKSYTRIPRPGKYVNPARHGPGGFANPTMLALGEYVDPLVFGPRVNSTFSGRLYPQAAMGDFQSPNQWGYSDLQNEYSDSQYNGNNHVKRCGCGSIYCDL